MERETCKSSSESISVIHMQSGYSGVRTNLSCLLTVNSRFQFAFKKCSFGNVY